MSIHKEECGSCPSCGAVAVATTFTEDGMVFDARKCSAGCGWWGS